MNRCNATRQTKDDHKVLAHDNFLNAKACTPTATPSGNRQGFSISQKVAVVVKSCHKFFMRRRLKLAANEMSFPAVERHICISPEIEPPKLVQFASVRC